MFEIRGAKKRYGAVEVLRGVDLTIEGGRTTVIIGTSGSGKSTTLRLCIGLVVPDEGEVRCDGEPITRARLPALRLRMGYVVADGGLFPHLTAAGNVALLARHLGWAPARVAARSDELAALMRLPGAALSRHPHELSSGQRQRVALMRALMLDPDVLLLDEPLGALDPMIRAELQTDLAAVFARLEKTVVMVTHDLAEAAFFGATVALMHEGRVLQAGPPGALFDAPADPFVTRFVNAQRRLTLDPK